MCFWSPVGHLFQHEYSDEIITGNSPVRNIGYNSVIARTDVPDARLVTDEWFAKPVLQIDPKECRVCKST
jgi:hypothetical protein